MVRFCAPTFPLDGLAKGAFIDYFVASASLEQCKALDFVVSDHKIVSVQWQQRLTKAPFFVLQTPPVLPKPVDASCPQWAISLEDAWNQVYYNPEASGTIDEKWEKLNNALCRALLLAGSTYQREMTSSIPPAIVRRGKPTEDVVKRQFETRTQPAGDFTSFRQRTLRNHLGRMIELRKRRCAENLTQASHKQLRDLEDKVQRSPHFDAASSLSHNIFKAERELENCCVQENRVRLRRWRDKVQHDHHAFRWLRRQVTDLKHAIKLDGGDMPASCVQEALEKLKTYWGHVWNRPWLNFEDTWAHIAPCLPPSPALQQWRDLTPEDLMQAAKKCKGSAVGIDGWSAEEMCLFTKPMWETLATFYRQCEESGCIPQAWNRVRQVHLGKGKPKEKDGAVLAANLRPISTSSMIWRVYNKARYRREDTQRWLRQVMPSCVYGGVPTRGTQDALGPLLECVNKGWYVGTSLMKHFGMDPKVANLLAHTWTHQERWLQLMGQTLPEAQHVSRSLPQGDSWSMTAMSFLLLPAVFDIRSKEPRAEQVVYADDRSFAASTAEEVARTANLWSTWAERLGLLENSTKAQFFHANVDGRRKLVAQGLRPQSVGDKIRILGYSFQGACARTADNHETKRIAEAKTRVLRCRSLPGSLSRKILFSATPKVAWGWLCRRPSLKDIKPWVAACRVLLKTPKQTSVPLANMIRGHRWDVRFMAVSTACSVLHRYVNRTGAALAPWRRAASGWVGALRRGMRDLGWVEAVTAWTWSHPQLGTRLSLARNNRGWQHDLRRVQHALRESWRHKSFNHFRTQDRIDASMCRNVPCNASRLKAIQGMTLSSHEFAVLTGASVSPARFRVMAPESQVGCPWCSCDPNEASLWHCAWGCAEAPRPAGLTEASCFDALQSRLGWPSGVHRRQKQDAEILRWLAYVRETTLRVRRETMPG